MTPRNLISHFLSSKPFLILDGAMGTELERRGYRTSLPLWSAMANLEAPVLVKQIHDDYIAAGADIITTNTFRTTGHTFAKVDKTALAPHLTRLAVEIAREAIVQSGKQALLAGSLAPLEDCYRPDLVPDRGVIEHEYSHQIDLLISTGVDFILAETMINHNEIAFISSCLREKEFPYMMSFTGDGNKLLDGTPLESVIPDVIAQEPIALMLNCRRCALLTSALPMLQSLYSGVIGVYGNGPGHPDDQLGWAPEEGSSDEYQKEVMKWIERGALIVGGCCGTTPEHIAEIHAFRESLL